MFYFFFCKQMTAYEMRISDWSSDVCSSDLGVTGLDRGFGRLARILAPDRNRTAGRIAAEQRALRSLQHFDAVDRAERLCEAVPGREVDAVEIRRHARLGGRNENVGADAAQVAQVVAAQVGDSQPRHGGRQITDVLDAARIELIGVERGHR